MLEFAGFVNSAFNEWFPLDVFYVSVAGKDEAEHRDALCNEQKV